MENNIYENLLKDSKYGFLRESTEKANSNVVTTNLTGLETYLKVIFPDVDDWVHDKAIGEINGVKYRVRPDYRSEKLKMIVEFDGNAHYDNPAQIVSDIKNTKLYESAGYKVVRIPFFIQLTNEVVKILFGVEVKEKLFPENVPSMLIKWKNTPAYMCPLGLEKMTKDLIKYPEQMETNLKALKEDADNNAYGYELTGYNLLIEKLKNG